MLRAGVIGVGHLGRFHAQKYSDMDGVKLEGVYDTNADRAKLVAEECKTKVFTTTTELLDNVDIVSIATPATNHHSVAKEALTKGIHCLIEKPFTRTVEEAKDLMNIASKHNAKIQIGHLERFNTVMSGGADLFKDPRFIECQRLAPFTARSTDINVILDLMIHDIDLVQGIVKSPIKDIDAIGVPVLTDKVDIAHAKIEFENGVMANLTASRISQKVFRKMRLFQRYSYVGLDFQKGDVEVFERVNKDGSFHIEGKTMPFGSTDALRKEISAFVSSVGDNSPVAVSAEDALLALQTAYKIIEKIEFRMVNL